VVVVAAALLRVLLGQEALAAAVPVVAMVLTQLREPRTLAAVAAAVE